MTDESNRIEQLEQANERLQAGLRQCHELVADLRHKLAANLNDPPKQGEGDWPEVATD